MEVNIILEGCDGTGKTSVAKELLKRLPKLLYLKKDAPQGLNEAHTEYCKDAVHMNGRYNLLFDRWALSECVYAPIFRKYYPNYMRRLENHLKSHNWLFLLTADKETLESRYDGQFIAKKQIPLILTRYEEEFEKSRYKNKVMIDVSKMGIEEIADFILKHLKGGENEHKKL